MTARRLDGAPLTEADRKFLELRDSGYRGPIDQDGNAVDGDEWLEANRPGGDR